MDRRKALKNTALLLGMSVSATTLGTLMQSCQEQERSDWQPIFFSKAQAQTLSAITEAILPKTGTPGALDLQVDMFVDLMFEKVLSPSDQQHVRKGYDTFVFTCQEMFGKTFTQLNEKEQTQVLEKVGSETNTFNPSIWGSTIGTQEPLDFFRRVKQFTLVGYYTSEYIGKEVLVYDPIPGEYDGCMPLGDEDNAWTL